MNYSILFLFFLLLHLFLNISINISHSLLYKLSSNISIIFSSISSIFSFLCSFVLLFFCLGIKSFRLYYVRVGKRCHHVSAQGLRTEEVLTASYRNYAIPNQFFKNLGPLALPGGRPPTIA